MPTLDLFQSLRDPAIDALHAATAHDTREVVVDEVLELADWPTPTGTLLDGGAGDGVFVTRPVARLALAPNDIEAVVARVEAWGIHPDAAAAVRLRLTRHLMGRGWDRSAAEVAADRVVIDADFLAPGPTSRRSGSIRKRKKRMPLPARRWRGSSSPRSSSSSSPSSSSCSRAVRLQGVAQNGGHHHPSIMMSMIG